MTTAVSQGLIPDDELTPCDCAPPRYQRLPVACDLSSAPLEEALLMTGYQPPTMTLYVGPRLRLIAPAFAKSFTGEHAGLVIVNIVVDDSLQPFEWFVEYGGKRAGSEAC